MVVPPALAMLRLPAAYAQSSVVIYGIADAGLAYRIDTGEVDAAGTLFNLRNPAGNKVWASRR
ncbi:hypothetical protein GJ700_09640 [Duganella sp. FT92W]|uniref:Uncharacterized protein n=1 Tax=Pseudoduganella rivuli TaxID=2666085 RepID=A0A7X2IL86_9BURK|nr:hypothetical protein [Pseudoduganella rivuli]MRV71974.1 hypothetical protein [Pseudoduganella rivuli]